eukprot:TRINITY_DN2177_c0_g1_i2.p1 TRINITY_DN2177_c0_g1~~TRINITY_DN2177_c0_g1_i2.p1  ORF type:complete len:123 (+),score=14.43 TRINITY_DN2177_c0_g1_i2:1-369(+)
MDSSLKLFIKDLVHLSPTLKTACHYRGKAFRRVWLQGTITAMSQTDPPRYIWLDDSTGVVYLDMSVRIKQNKPFSCEAGFFFCFWNIDRFLIFFFLSSKRIKRYLIGFGYLCDGVYGIDWIG